MLALSALLALCAHAAAAHEPPLPLVPGPALPTPPPDPALDLRKRLVELPLERALLSSSPFPADVLDVPWPTALPSPAADPLAAVPGLVAWHPSPGAALAAARSSGRPVLVFQLLGRLDEEHC